MHVNRSLPEGQGKAVRCAGRLEYCLRSGNDPIVREVSEGDGTDSVLDLLAEFSDADECVRIHQLKKMN